MAEFLTGEDMDVYAERRREELAKDRAFERRTFGLRSRVQTGGVGGGTLDLPIKPAAAWYRFGVGITAPGGFVSQWNDASGNNRHLIQATATNQPQLMPDTSILFDGLDNYMQTAAFTLNQPETIYFLGRQVTWTDTDVLYDGGSATTARMRQTTVTPTLRLVAGTETASLDNTNLAVNTYAVLVAVVNGSSSLIQVNNTAATTGDAGAANMGGFTLGAAGGIGAFSNIQVKEVVIYAAAHNAAQRSQIINYLAQVGTLSI